MLPGWYGFGSAVATAASTIAELADLHDGWPFFSSALANMEMVLAKADMTIARRYADLVEDQALADARLRPDPAPSGSAPARPLLAITGQSALLDKQPGPGRG